MSEACFCREGERFGVQTGLAFRAKGRLGGVIRLRPRHRDQFLQGFGAQAFARDDH